MMIPADFKGIWPVLTVPFLANGEVDETSLQREIDFLLKQSVDGLVIFGLASEIYKLSERERIRITELVVSHVQGRVPVIAGTEHSGTEIAAKRSYEAQEMGVSGVMVYPPTFVKPDAQGVVDYYEAISEKISIPLMIQDAQAWTQVPMPVDMLVQMNRRFKAVQYVKIETVPTGPKMSKVIESSEGRLKVFGGYGGLYYCDEMQRGAIGTLIPPAIADYFVQIHRDFHSGEKKRAETIHQELLPFLLFEMTTLDTLIEIQKEMFHRAGIFESTFMRKPHVAMDRLQHSALDGFLQKYDFALLRKKR